jgi:5-methyltetrahydropteroyltriglutamate--homocysteine methyltransferase
VVVKRSTERILTTHTGSLIRPVPILQGMKARTIGAPYDQERLDRDIAAGIADVVRQQVDIGIDIPNDGEFARQGFLNYAHERFNGLESRSLEEGEDVWSAAMNPEHIAFPEFFDQYYSHFRYLWMPPEVSLDDVPNLPGNYERFRLTAPITYKGNAAVKRDIETLRSALDGLNIADAFITAVTPMSRKNDRDVRKFYPSVEAYLYALADVLHEDYTAIVDAGFILQLDLAVLSPRRQAILLETRNPTPEQIRGAIELGVEVVNYSLRGIPEDRVRYHHCWGSMNSPHTQDTALREIIHDLLKINAQAYVLEAANPRHEHEWMVWQDVKLPDGKILIPGFISHQTNVVEHPELVAWRIKNYASVVGKENLIAGVDCGFSQYWDSIRVHPTVQWAKLKALVDGAALASQELW